MKPYPLEVLRKVSLVAQGLHNPIVSQSDLTADSILRVINLIGCIQIDSLHVVRRSHYLVPWSRLGNYDPSILDGLLFGPKRQLFEGWEHAATIIPLEEYRYQMPHQRNLREHPTSWYQRWLEGLVNKEFVPQVLDRIRREGALRVSDFESDGKNRGSWWDWRPAKVALEYLYAFGDLMISDRVHFQRSYDLTERVLPEWVDRTEPSAYERDLFWVERGAKALGVCLPRHAGDYIWMKVTRSKPIVEQLLSNGVLEIINGQGMDGTIRDLIIHRDNLHILELVSSGAIECQRTSFLSPFDNLFWAARRDELFWGFRQSLECYLPASKRVYGYFSLPILHHDKLIGRFDPKLDRKTNTLFIRALYLEPGIKTSAELVNDLTETMRDFMGFHQAHHLEIEYCIPSILGKKLLRALPS
jgi:uncharacterized protein YcaQ